jgi:hypothetical protein
MVEPLGDVLDRAAQLSASGRRRKAVALLRGTAAAHPDSPEVWCRLAAALLDRGDATAALAAARRAVPLGGDRAWAHRLVSKALSRLDRHAEAVTAARQAVRLEPTDWRCRISLAEAFGAAGSWPDAVDAAAQAVRYQPDHVRPYLVLGDAARRTGDIVTAERAYRTALRRKPGDSRVRAELARLRQPASWSGAERPIANRSAAHLAFASDGQGPRRFTHGRDHSSFSSAGRRADRPGDRAAGRRAERPAGRRAVDRAVSPIPESLAWRGIRQLAMTLVIADVFLMVAGLPKPTPVLAWLGFAIPCVVVVLAFVELVRVPAGSRLAVLAMPLRRPVIGLSCVLLALSTALVLLWAVLDRAGAGTMEPLVFALVCAVCAGAVSLVNES